MVYNVNILIRTHPLRILGQVALMLEKVKDYIEKHRMLSKGDKVVAGLSGGADSVALLHILKELKGVFGIEIVAAHVNHGLRGEEADEDEEFARALCEKWGIGFYHKKADVRGLAAAWRKSEEETGRIVRYEFFKEVLSQTGAARIATAHHKNDQAETILHNIIRGTGLEGLSGIKPVRDGCFIRPLLCVSRREIEDYLKAEGLTYRTDATNAQLDYTRNRIRNLLIPALEEYNPSVVDSIARLGSLALEENEFMTGYSEGLFEKCSVADGQQVDIKLDGFLSCHRAVQRRLVRLAMQEIKSDLDGISYVHIEDIIDMAAASRTGSRLMLPAGIHVIKGYGYLRFTCKPLEQKHEYFEVPLPVPGRVELDGLGVTVTAEVVDSRERPVYSGDCIYIDAGKVRGSLRLRQRRDGDRFKPLGMNGTKKLKDFFIDRKIPVERRDSIPLLADEDNIIWVVGLQMNEDYKLTAATEKIIRFRTNAEVSYAGPFGKDSDR